MVPFDLVLDQPREVGRVLKGLPKDHDRGGEVSRRETRWAMCLFSCGITMGRRGFGGGRSLEGIHSLEFGAWGQGFRQWQLAVRGLGRSYGFQRLPTCDSDYDARRREYLL